MEIHLVRHTQVEIDHSVCYGQLDVGLRTEYIDDFKKINFNSDYDIVVSSPLQRCTQMASFFNFNYSVDSRLQEINFGNWENMKWDDIPAEEIQPWYEDYIHTRPPNGESVIDFRNRIEAFKNDFLAHNHGDKILIITHSGVIRMFLHLILQFPLDHLFDFIPDYGKKCVLKKNGDFWKILSFNT